MKEDQKQRLSNEQKSIREFFLTTGGGPPSGGERGRVKIEKWKALGGDPPSGGEGAGD